MANLMIVGPPGAGKGTQAAEIAQSYGIPAISTGDIFRKNIKEKTELGQRVTAILDAGDYVPDELTNELVRDRLSQQDAKAGYLLDGYPRTAGQVDFLDSVNEGRGEKLDAVVRLTADTDEVVRRLLARALDQGRRDDTEDVIRKRLEVYERETAPLISIYAERGLLVEVDGIGAVEAVTDRIITGLSNRGIEPTCA